MNKEELILKLKEIGIKTIFHISEDFDACGLGCCTTDSELIIHFKNGDSISFSPEELENL